MNKQITIYQDADETHQNQGEFQSISPFFHPKPNQNSDAQKKTSNDQPTSKSQTKKPHLNVLLDRRHIPTQHQPVWQRLDDIELRLNASLATLEHPPDIAAVYNPTIYARATHLQYLRRFLADQRPRVLFVGMNPGPWGMCQTGVPFGCVTAVDDWLRLRIAVDQPAGETLPAYPVLGAACKRSEISGQRFWQLMRQVFGTAEAFFARCFVHNLCPIAMFRRPGRNVTPADLPASNAFRKALERLCSDAVMEFLALCDPNVSVVCVGAYVHRLLNVAVQKNDRLGGNARVLRMDHPSPRSVNNSDWIVRMHKWMIENDIAPRN